MTVKPPTVERGPWYFATLIVPCPECGASVGEVCRDGDRERAAFHLRRYASARALAGFPLNPDRLTSPVHP